jgi:hypothetical protein
MTTTALDYEIAPAGVSKGILWTSYIVSAIPVFMLLFSSVLKLMKPPAVVKGFNDFGYPQRLILILGVVELACTVVYMIPRTSVLGAILLTGYLGGATATHVRINDPSFVGPVLFGVMIWLGLFLRDRRLRALIPLRS